MSSKTLTLVSNTNTDEMISTRQHKLYVKIRKPQVEHDYITSLRVTEYIHKQYICVSFE